MARKPVYPALTVSMNGRTVGGLTKNSTGPLSFRYAGDWLNWQHAIAISHSMSLREDRYEGEVVRTFFDHLLPEGGHLRRRLVATSAATGVDEFSLLHKLGRECAGSISMTDQVKSTAEVTLNNRLLNEAIISRSLKGLGQTPLGISRDNQLRFTLSGSQAKTALLKQGNDWLIPGFSFATTHILKPAIGRLPDQDLSLSVENEFLCLQILQVSGLPVANNAMETSGDNNVLVVERFDRLWTRDDRLLRLPQEDFCQALAVPTLMKYEQEGGPAMVEILNLLKGSDQPDRDRTTFISAQIVYWLMAATDGHSKNYSIFLKPGGGFSLAPLYDVMSAQPLFDRGQLSRENMRMSMSVGRQKKYRVDEILPFHFIETAAAARMAKHSIIDAMAVIRSQMPLAIKQVVDKLPVRFPEKLRFSVMNGIQQRLRLLNAVVQ